MAGLSSRFLKAGYTIPKYMLYIRNRSLFYLSVHSFEKYFNNNKFIFITRNIFDSPKFIQEECKLLGISNYNIVSLNQPTKGQAETVYLGIQESLLTQSEDILIFNIDTFRPNFTLPDKIMNWDGYLECFIGSGSNWSYAKTLDDTAATKVIKTAEKQEISNFCSTGIYYFKRCSDFIEAYTNEYATNKTKELYIAPLYNYLINKNKAIHIHIIGKNEVFFCGTPEEYIQYTQKEYQSL